MEVADTYHRVSEVARLTGVSVRALHHYDEIGLLVPSRRSAKGYRLYGEDDLLRLQQIEIASDLDAIQIYMQNGNWSRAVNLLDELRDKAYGETAVLISLLFDMAMILHDSDMRQAPVAVRESVAFLFDGQPADAAHILLTEGSDRHTQWLLAERISAFVPDIQLLRPNLYRLELALKSLASEGVPMTEPASVLYLPLATALSALVSFKRPQSSSRTSGQRPGTLVKNTLSGLRSRWTMPLSCAAISADAISSTIDATSATCSAPVRLSFARSDSPTSRSMT